ncbi:nitrate reductase [Microdochium bolleyi]|uniref:Nitrate reductase [NADPH] n=1 Tax=Microdochium bolleyi TaxID=196109 RepID=A0A136IQP1_9PEZI|nr:nitrate reductase [Microdochium bolleyi]
MAGISTVMSWASMSSTASSSATTSDPGEASSPLSSVSSASTTPEPGTPETKARDQDLLYEPFEGRPFYDELTLPRIPKTQPVQPLSLDGQNPDNWVPRDERMVRLTGKHPFNSEAPLSALFNNGFLTPQNLFYVRNHGAVPKVTPQQAQDWKMRVHGLVEREMEFSIQDLKDKFPTVTLPITLVCAGNRRKEQNVVTKGLGFNWGAGGVSTGLFTGVYLSDILKYCQPKRPLLSSYPSYDTVVPGRARHVVFEGIDELPKGKYGTSQRLGWAMDQEKGMLIAWGLNGEDLSPDHGYPLRLVVPGQIGGRMVKWLNRIEVSDRESQHHLHFFDNKLLPTQVTAEQARNEDKWWYDPKYIINELNVNAALCSPDHNQVVPIAPAASDASAPKQTLPLEGYAYTGGGRRITRVEISLDDGRNWEISDVTYPEDLYRMHPIQNHPYFGQLDLSMTEMSFCWCFWKMELDMQRLIDQDVRVISVRAIDESLQHMPRDMAWTAMSMMNSWWFRVVVHKEDGGRSLRFEHPAPVDHDNRGWMARLKDEGLDPRYPHFGGDSPFSPPASSLSTTETTSASSAEPVLSQKDKDLALMLNPEKTSTIITAAQLAEHADSEGPEPWFVVYGHVFDGTAYLQDHPGGAQSIQLVAGEDATEDFMAIHSADAKKMLRDYHIGRLEESSTTTTLAAPIEQIDDDPSKPFLEPKRWKKTRLVQKTAVSRDSRIFRFALAHEDQLIGLPVGQHVYVRIRRTNKLTGETETVQRAYTPYSGNSQRGYLDILIKVYFPSEAGNNSSTTTTAAAFAGGRMTMLLEKLPIGIDSDDMSIELKGPLGHFTYLGQGQVQWKPAHRPRTVRKLAMIAGGSGITPIWSTLKAIADEYMAGPPPGAAAGREPIQIWIVYGNRTEDDILIRREMEELCAALQDNLRIWHVLSLEEKVTKEWKMGRGRVGLECLREHLPPPPPAPVGDELEDTLALVCGPPAMEKGVSTALEELGWDLERTVVFF